MLQPDNEVVVGINLDLIVPRASPFGHPAGFALAIIAAFLAEVIAVVDVGLAQRPGVDIVPNGGF